MHRDLAFTLIEVLVTLGVIAILAVALFAGLKVAKPAWQQSVDLANLRSLGAACQMYANDNNGALPRVRNDTICWMRMLWPYVPSAKVFASPSDPQNCLVTKKPVNVDANNTSYVMNGFNDLTSLNGSFAPKFTMIESPSSTLLLAIKALKVGDRYVDLALRDQDRVPDYARYGGKSVYVMTDGSAKKINSSEFEPSLWLSRKKWPIP